jgi:adenylate cyclase
LERKLTAILCADVHGYSRLMGEDEEATIRILSAHRRIIDGLIEQHHGRFVNSAGDSVLAEFASAVNAVECAVQIQTALKTENADVPTGRRMEFRIGVNLGDVVMEGAEIYGDGVNIAARLESLAEPGSIYISASIHEQIRNKLALGYQDLGEQRAKNISEPVRVWRVVLDGAIPVRRATRRNARSYWRGGVLSLTGLAIIIGTIVLIQHLSLRPPGSHASIPPQEKPVLTLPSIPSIAVLPFTNLSGDSQQEYFSDGISDQLINDLSRLPGLFVIARNSSFAYKGKATNEHDIGRELGVKYVLEGSVQKSSGRIRIGVELVDASSAAETWTQRFDRPIKDIFAVQDEIVGKVVATLGLIFNREETRVPWGNPQPTTNLEAYDDLLRAGQYEARFTKDDSLMSRRWIEKAIGLDPDYAGAYVGLAGNYFSFALFGWSDNSAADLNHAAELAEKALSLDDSDSGALATLCEIHWLQRRFDQALSEGERAVALNANSVGAYGALVDALTVSNRPADLAEAVRLVEKEMRLDPSRRDFYAYFLAAPYVEMGRYQEAIPLLKRHLAVYPNMAWAHAALIVAYTELGREQDAQAEAVELNRISPRFLAHAGVGRDPALNRRQGDDLRKAGLK